MGRDLCWISCHSVRACKIAETCNSLSPNTFFHRSSIVWSERNEDFDPERTKTRNRETKVKPRTLLVLSNCSPGAASCRFYSDEFISRISATVDHVIIDGGAAVGTDELCARSTADKILRQSASGHDK